MTSKNLFADIPADLAEELFTPLLSGRDFRLERIVSLGHVTPAGQWYDQQEDEWVLLLTGAAELEIAGEDASVALRPGDHLLLPAGLRHRVSWTDPNEKTVWLALHYNSSCNSSAHP